jgi:hypothetical protein
MSKILAMTFPEQQAFDTHFNYISCLANLLNGATLKYTHALTKAGLSNIDEKKNLIKLTKQSLNDESHIVAIDKDYSYASTSWLPIKAYYLIFNILLTIEYIIKIQKNAFSRGHHACVEEFTRKLKDKEIEFSVPELNVVYDQSILNHKNAAGANLSKKTSDADMYKMAMRKIANYKLEDWKKRNHINGKKKADRARLAHYLTNVFFVSIFDFPYFMRIRSNYRDFAFIEGVSTTDTARYFNEYVLLTARFVKTLEELKKALIKART